MATSEAKKIAITIKALTPQQLGLCEEVLQHRISSLQQLAGELHRLPASLSKPEALLLLTLLGQLPAASQEPIKPLMDQLRSTNGMQSDGGTVIHFPPP